MEDRNYQMTDDRQYLLLDVWLALGGNVEGFEKWMGEPRRTWDEAWAQLMAWVRHNSGVPPLPADTTLPPPQTLAAQRIAELETDLTWIWDHSNDPGVVERARRALNKADTKMTHTCGLEHAYTDHKCTLPPHETGDYTEHADGDFKWLHREVLVGHDETGQEVWDSWDEATK